MLYVMYIPLYIYSHVIMKAMCYHPGYYCDGFDNIYTYIHIYIYNIYT